MWIDDSAVEEWRRASTVRVANFRLHSDVSTRVRAGVLAPANHRLENRVPQEDEASSVADAVNVGCRVGVTTCGVR